MDISETLAPKSDQQNFDDYLAGPKIVTVTAGIVTQGEQPLVIELAEYPGRPYKPSKSMRRALADVWGTETDHWIGRRLKLVGNPTIRYGGKQVGGIEVEAVSDITSPKTIQLTETRGKKRPHTIYPLPPEQSKQGEQGIPDAVITDLNKAIEEGTTAEYFAWLTEQGAPAHILNFVTERTPK